MGKPGNPAVPRTLTVMAGPIDTRVDPTVVNDLATSKPLSWFERNVITTVPMHYPGARRLGHGKGYRYPHDYPGHAVEQEYRPARYSGRRYYEPSGEGEEAGPPPEEG